MTKVEVILTCQDCGFAGRITNFFPQSFPPFDSAISSGRVLYECPNCGTFSSIRRLTTHKDFLSLSRR